MSLPIVNITKYDLLMKNIPVTLTSECLIVLKDTGDILHWDPERYRDMCTNARIDRYTQLVNQMDYNKNNVGCTVDINGKIESPYENIVYSDRTTTNSYKYIGGGGASTAYFPDKTVAELRYATQKEAIDTRSRMNLKVDGKHVLCLSCSRFIHTPKIGKYNDRYCENCGCYMPELMFGKE